MSFKGFSMARRGQWQNCPWTSWDFGLSFYTHKPIFSFNQCFQKFYGGTLILPCSTQTCQHVKMNIIIIIYCLYCGSTLETHSWTRPPLWWVLYKPLTERWFLPQKGEQKVRVTHVVSFSTQC